MQKIFGNAPAAQQQSPAATQQATPGNMPMNASPMTNTNGVVPANVNMETTKPEVQSPMADFKELFNTDPNAKTTEPDPLFNIDPTKVAAASKNIDFSKAVPADVLARITAGGEDAQKAMLEAMNLMQQQQNTQGTILTAKIVEQALEKQRTQLMDMLPGIIKNTTTFDSLRNTNTLLQNPATAPIAEAVLKQVQLKFPTASAEDHKKQVEQYFADMATVIKAPEAELKEKTAKANETDWSSFLPEQ